MNDSLIHRLFSIPGVRSVGWGYKVKGGKQLDRECLIVGVEKKRRFLWRRHRIPTRIEGWETDVIQAGKIMALQSRTDKWRPAPGGVSIGHPDITAGTLGCLVKVIGKAGWRILSNNHVLANSNQSQLGDSIYQPGIADGSTEADKVAELEAFEPIRFGGAYNYADCAIALPVLQSDVSPEILEIGEPAGYAEAGLGMAVKKSGRTTGLNSSVVQQIGAVVQVQYPDGQIAHFYDQLITGNMSAGGDSGSVALDMDNQIVGLLFAGSPEVTVVSPIGYVVDALDLDTGEGPGPPPDELRITAFYKFSDDDWVVIGEMDPAGFEYQLAWPIPKEGICRLKYIVEETGKVSEIETGDFTIDFAEPGIVLTPIYPKGGETVEAREILLRVKIERV